MLVDKSSFTDNQASDGGGALFISGDCLEVNITNSNFSLTDPEFDSPKGVFVLSSSSISIDSTTFKGWQKDTLSSLLTLEMLTTPAEILKMEIYVFCPKWHNLTVFTTFVEQQAKEVILTCTSCPVSLYVPSDGQFRVTYTPGTANISVDNNKKQAKQMHCLPCPPGAECPGYDLTAKPNFWGLTSHNEVSMYQCPTDYCCTDNCTDIDQCSAHRTGLLCGSCQANYSLSMLSSECIPSEQCEDMWLWPVLLLAVFSYLGWYTFKNDIFFIPTLIRKRMGLCCSPASKDEQVDDTNVDKGFFGIVTHFVQVKSIMKLSLSVDKTNPRIVDNFFSETESIIDIVLNFELTYFSQDACSVRGLTTTQRTIFKLLFLFGLFLSWTCIILQLYLMQICLHKKTLIGKKLPKFRTKLYLGLVEIIKYTYLGFTSAVFYSLTCCSVGESFVWFYDGSVPCYSKWQIAMIAFTLVYLLPYPLLLFVLMKRLQNGQKTRFSFFIATYFPLPVLMFWITEAFQQENNTRNQTSDPKQHDPEEVENVIYEGFKGGFQESESVTQFWEAVVMLRNLLISFTILIPNALIQLSVCFALCIISLIHHLYIKPFRHPVSNHSETLSLSLLCVTAAINLLKTAFLFSDLSPQGSQIAILRNLELVDRILVVILVIFTLCFETVNLFYRETKQNFIVSAMVPFKVFSHRRSQQHKNKTGQSSQISKENMGLEAIAHASEKISHQVEMKAQSSNLAADKEPIQQTGVLFSTKL